MKKLLLFVTVIGFGIALQAQNEASQLLPQNPEMIRTDMNIQQGNHPAIPRNINGRGPVSFIQLGSSYNIYSILLNGQNQVMYNSDINSITFIHRQNNGGNGGSGVLSFDVSTDGGLSWITNTGPLTPGIVSGSAATNGCRYPSATIYNPTGNTNASNAFIVGMGPALVPGQSWGYLFQVSSKLDGSNVSENYPLNPGNPYAFHPYGMDITPNGTAYNISTLYNNSGDATLDTITYSKFFLNKGVFNNGNQNFDWNTVDTFAPDFFRYVSSFSGYEVNFAGTWNMAFSPDGMTGYILVIGAEKGGLDTVPKPIVWKSADGGVSWGKMSDFDFGSLPLMQSVIVPTQQGDVRPYFSGADVVVDNNGRLHIFCEVLSQFSSSADSVTFIYNNPQTDGFHTAFLMDVSGSSSLDIDAIMIDTIYNSDGTLPDGSGGNLGIDSRVQVSRSEDGKKIFYSWCATDVATAGTTDNILPNVLGRGLDVATGKLTFIKNFTMNSAFDGSVFYPTLSPVSISQGDDYDFEMPIVFAEPGATALDAPQYYFIKGAGFNENDFGATAPNGIKTNQIPELSLYPNPSNGLVYIDAGTANGTIEVFDLIGKSVLITQLVNGKATLDLTHEATGVYLVKVAVDGQNSVYKIAVQ